MRRQNKFEEGGLHNPCGVAERSTPSYVDVARLQWYDPRLPDLPAQIHLMHTDSCRIYTQEKEKVQVNFRFSSAFGCTEMLPCAFAEEILEFKDGRCNKTLIYPANISDPWRPCYLTIETGSNTQMARRIGWLKGLGKDAVSFGGGQVLGEREGGRKAGERGEG